MLFLHNIFGFRFRGDVMPKTYNYNGTVSQEVKKIYNYTGTQSQEVKKAFSWNGTLSQIVYQNAIKIPYSYFTSGNHQKEKVHIRANDVYIESNGLDTGGYNIYAYIPKYWIGDANKITISYIDMRSNYGWSYVGIVSQLPTGRSENPSFINGQGVKVSNNSQTLYNQVFDVSGIGSYYLVIGGYCGSSAGNCYAYINGDIVCE